MSFHKQQFLKSRVYRICGVDGPGGDQLVYNIAYAIIMARLQYLRRPEPLPEHNDIDGMARYWKKFYNTPAGAGQVTEFINSYQRFCA